MGREVSSGAGGMWNLKVLVSFEGFQLNRSEFGSFLFSKDHLSLIEWWLE